MLFDQRPSIAVKINKKIFRRPGIHWGISELPDPKQDLGRKRDGKGTKKDGGEREHHLISHSLPPITS